MDTSPCENRAASARRAADLPAFASGDFAKPFVIRVFPQWCVLTALIAAIVALALCHDHHSAMAAGIIATASGLVLYAILRRMQLRIQAREKLVLEHCRLFFDVVQTSHDGILLVDGNQMLDCNDAAVRMLGHEGRASFLARDMGDLSPDRQPDGSLSREKFAQIQADAIRCGYRRVEWTLRKSDGVPLQVEASLTPVEYAGRKYLHVVWRDISSYRRVEETLLQERHLLRTLIDNLPDGIYAKDLLGRKTLSNKADVHGLGQKYESDVINKTDFDFYAKEDAENFALDDQMVLATGEPLINKEDSFIRQNGEKRWLLTSKLPLHASDGKVVGLLGIWHNITERRKTEEAMKKRIELDECLSQMIRTLLRGMKIRRSFQDPLAILGRGVKTSRVILFRESPDRVHPSGIEIIDQWAHPTLAHYPARLESGLPYPDGWIDFQRVMPGGVCFFGDSRRWEAAETGAEWRKDIKTYLLAPVYIEAPEGRAFWGFLTFAQCDEFRQWDENDIEIAKSAADLVGMFLTRREEVEQLHLLGAAVESAQESFIITDADLEAPGPRILFANPAAEMLSGYNEKELVGHSPRILQGPETSRETLDRLKHELAQGLPFHGITTNYRKDGTPYQVDWNIAPVRNPEGRITHFVSVQRDITQQQAMVKRVAMANRLESVGSLAAGIAHEINSPAQFIGDNLQYAYDSIRKVSAWLESRGYEIDPKIAQPLFEEIPLALTDALEGLSRIDKIVKSMREFAHPGQEVEPTDVNRCMETSVTICRNEWKHVAQIEFHLDPAMPMVPCVRSDINQVLVNLIVNAAQAISSQKRPSMGRIVLSTKATQNWAEILVEDDGPGIPHNIADKIFDPFFTTKPVGQGTGQGLFISQQRIVGKHHGRISASNLPTGGAAFLIQLPLETAIA